MGASKNGSGYGGMEYARCPHCGVRMDEFRANVRAAIAATRIPDSDSESTTTLKPQ